MNGDGIRTTSTADPVFFDLDADGVKEWVSWSDAAGEEAFLYRDVNGNHTIDAGDELFGTSTLLDSGEAAPNGFEALRDHDRDRDGVISPTDGAWGELRLWIDRDHNGSSAVHEDASLGSLGVRSISLAYESVDADQDYGVDANGNHHRFRGVFTRSVNGVEKTFSITDVFFDRRR